MTIKFNMSTALKVICAVLLAAQLFFVGLSPAMAQETGSTGCVVEAEALCTRDLNICGNPSICRCQDGYSYDASVGKCIIDDISQATSPGVLVNSKCAFTPKSICTFDLNVCGNSSVCACPEGTDYNPLIGACVIPLR